MVYLFSNFSIFTFSVLKFLTIPPVSYLLPLQTLVTLKPKHTKTHTNYMHHCI